MANVTTLRNPSSLTDESQLRIDLAAAFRMAAHLGWHEAVANHFSLAVSPDGRKFLMNPKARHFARIKASDLLLLDSDDKETMNRPGAPDASAWCIHGHLHALVPHARCVLHVHPPYATALACLRDPEIKPIDQNNWLWGTGGVQEANRTPANTSAQTEGSGTSTAVGHIDLGPQLTSAFDKTRSALQQVNDGESAKRALPQLDDVNAQLDKLLKAAALASDQQKKIVVDLATKVQPGIQDLMDKELAKPGVADVLKPTLDAFKSKLAALASA